MLGLVLGVLGALFIAVSVLGAVFVIGMRRKSGFVQAPVIWLGKHGFNKVGLKTAGRPGAATAIIRHRGRVSGRTLETPIGAVATEDGFVISLPYGLRSNWLRNVLASGTAELVHEGETWVVDRPEIIALSPVEKVFAATDQRMHRIFNVTEVLRLRRSSTAGLAETADPSAAIASPAA